MRFLLSLLRALPLSGRFTSSRAVRRGFFEVFAATLAFGALHSLLCLPQTKGLARRVFGERYGRGFYRLFFQIQSLLTTGALVAFILSRPQKTLYRASKTRLFLHVAVQLCGLLIAGWGVKELRFRRFAGFDGARDALADAPEIAEPETQSPDGGDGLPYERGPFRWSRHAVEWIILVIMWATPILQTNWIAFFSAATIYMVLGVLQSEKRLAAKGGDAWQRYAARVHLLLGRSGARP